MKIATPAIRTFIIAAALTLSAIPSPCNEQREIADSMFTEKYIYWAAGKQNSPAELIIDSLIRREQQSNYATIPHHRLIIVKAFVESRQFRPSVAIALLNSIYNTPELRNDPKSLLKASSLLYNEYRVLNQLNEATKYALISIKQAIEQGDYRVWSICKIAYLEDRSHVQLDPSIPIDIGNIVATMEQHPDQCAKDDIAFAKSIQADIEVRLNNFNHAIELYDQIIAIYKSVQPNERVGIDLERDEDLAFNIGQAYLLQAMIYVKARRMDEAEQTFLNAQRYLENMPLNLSSVLYSTIADYLIATQRYDEALDHLHRYEAAAQKSDTINTPLEKLKSLLATIYFKKEDYKNAYKYRDQASVIADSLYARANFASANQMSAIYQNAQNETQILNQKLTISTFSSYIIGLSVAIIALLIIVIMVIDNARKIRRKNKILFDQIIKLGATKQSDSVDQTNDSKEWELFQKIDQHIKQNNSYLDPNISREQIASQIGTNKTYLSTAIHNAREQTFGEYINSLRLEHAKKILLNNWDMKVEAVASVSGFNSSRTFYRLFHQTYSLTPTQFRDLSRTKATSKH